MDKFQYGVHQAHCCVQHGCKYGDKDCPVVKKEIKQDYLCEFCKEDGIISTNELLQAGLLEQAIEISVKAHKGQVDKGGEPYILHPLRVMINQVDDVRKIVAVLHDVVEDSDITLHYLSLIFNKEIIDALDCLTHHKGESYFDYIVRIKTNVIATQVKISDLIDNMNLGRLKEVSAEDMKRRRKYVSSSDYLSGYLTKEELEENLISL